MLRHAAGTSMKAVKRPALLDLMRPAAKSASRSSLFSGDRRAPNTGHQTSPPLADLRRRTGRPEILYDYQECRPDWQSSPSMGSIITVHNQRFAIMPDERA